MKKVLIASVFVLGLAACGGGGSGAKSALVKSCLDDGSEDEATCTCMADLAVDKLDPKLVDMLVEATKQEDDDAYMMAQMSQLSPEDMTSFMTVMMSAATECGVEM